MAWYDFDPAICDEDRVQPDYVNTDEEAVKKFSAMCRKRHVKPEEVLQMWEDGVKADAYDTRRYDKRRGMHLMVESHGVFEAVMMDMEDNCNGKH